MKVDAPAAGKRERAEIPALTGVRGLAALVVALGHTAQVFFSPTLFEEIVRFIPMDQAVDFFFVLSGFILCTIYGGANNKIYYLKFIQLRFARIWPLHLLMLMPAAIKVCVGIGISAVAGRLISEALMVHAWPVLGHFVLFNGPSWSVSIEWFSYLIIYPCLLSLSPRLSPRTMLLLICSTLGAELVVLLTLPSNEGYVIARGTIAIFRGMVGFCIGWFCCDICRTNEYVKKNAPRVLDFTIMVGIIFILMIGFYAIQETKWFWMLLILFPGVVCGLGEGGYFNRLCSSRLVHFLGLISYSIYLAHIPFMGLWRLVFPVYEDVDSPLLIVSWAGYGVCLIGFSYAAYCFCEVPSRQWIRKLNFQPTESPR